MEYFLLKRNLLLRSCFLLFVLTLFQNCSPAMKIFKTPTFSEEKNVNCIIEIPAGTSKKIEFNKTSKKFAVDLRDGKERIIEYLPYPGNYGFIASTYSNPEEGGEVGLSYAFISHTMQLVIMLVMGFISIPMLAKARNEAVKLKEISQ